MSENINISLILSKLHDPDRKDFPNNILFAIETCKFLSSMLDNKIYIQRPTSSALLYQNSVHIQ